MYIMYIMYMYIHVHVYTLYIIITVYVVLWNWRFKVLWFLPRFTRTCGRTMTSDLRTCGEVEGLSLAE